MRESDKLESWLNRPDAKRDAADSPDKSADRMRSRHANSEVDHPERLEAWLRGESGFSDRHPHGAHTAAKARSQVPSTTRMPEASRLEAWLAKTSVPAWLPESDMEPRGVRQAQVSSSSPTASVSQRRAGSSRSPVNRVQGPEAALAAPSQPSLSIVRYAQIKSALWRGELAIQDMHREHGIDEITFREFDARIDGRTKFPAPVGHDHAEVGLRELLREVNARSTLAPVEASMNLEAYVAVVAALSCSENVEAVLDKAGLTQASWDRQRRAFRRTMRGNASLRRTFRRALKEAKERLASADGTRS